MYWLLRALFTCALSLNEFPHKWKQASLAAMIETTRKYGNVSFREPKNTLSSISRDLGKELAGVSESQLMLMFTQYSSFPHLPLPLLSQVSPLKALLKIFSSLFLPLASSCAQYDIKYPPVPIWLTAPSSYRAMHSHAETPETHLSFWQLMTETPSLTAFLFCKSTVDVADLNVGRDLTSQVFVPHVLMTKALWEWVSFSRAVKS